MRKIATRGEEGKRKRRNQLIVGIVLVLVMLFSVLGYGFRSQEPEEDSKKVIYNGFEFESSSDFWLLEMGNTQFVFKYNPKEVERVGVELNSLASYQGKPLYISSENEEAEFEIYRNLDQFVLRRQYACLDEPCAGDLPVKTCEDNFIIIRENNVSNIIQDNNCVFILGPRENLTRISDEFLFKIIGVE